jgi:hypothetical protein
VDEADRAELLRAVDSIDVQPSWEPPLNPLGELPAYVVAAGEHGPGDPWRLDLRPAGEALELTLEGRGGEILTADATAAPQAWSGTDPVFGVVAEGAGEVAFQPGSENMAYDLGGTPVAGTLVDVPPTLDTFGLDLFVIDLPAGQAGLAGRVLVDGRSTSPTESVFPDGTPRTDAVELIGSDLGHPWSVRFTGAFADRTACIAVTIDDETFDPHCPRPRLFLAGGRPNLSGWVTPSLHLLAGTVPLEVVGIDFVSDTPDQPLASARCEPGPAGWTDPDRRVCVAVLAAEGSGTVRYLGAEGEVVFEEPMAWDAGPAVDIPTPVQPTHGGTYWAVYAWLGAPGDPEADEVSDRLLADFGIEAFPGDLACDQGATEAVGAEYSWRVAVYFGSEEDAQVFAKRTGLLDAGPWESVVRVTTYCLD